MPHRACIPVAPCNRVASSPRVLDTSKVDTVFVMPRYGLRIQLIWGWRNSEFLCAGQIELQ